VARTASRVRYHRERPATRRPRQEVPELRIASSATRTRRNQRRRDLDPALRSGLERQGIPSTSSPPPAPTRGRPHIVRIPSVPSPSSRRCASPPSTLRTRTPGQAREPGHHPQPDPFGIGSSVWRWRAVSGSRTCTPITRSIPSTCTMCGSRASRATGGRLSRDFCDQCDLVIAPRRRSSGRCTAGASRPRCARCPPASTATGIAPSTRPPPRRSAGGSRSSRRPRAHVRRSPGREKNIDLLIEAMARVKTPGRDCCSSATAHREELERTSARSAEGPSHVRRLPRAGRCRRAYATADVFFFASTSETQGLVIAEAMASGCPSSRSTTWPWLMR